MSEQPETPGTPHVQERLAVTVTRRAGTGVVAVSGELDHDTAAALTEAVRSLLEPGVTRIVVDCSELGFCDSTGLNVLLKARQRLADGGGRFVLAAPGRPLRRLLELTGADAVFDTEADLAAALAEA